LQVVHVFVGSLRSLDAVFCEKRRKTQEFADFLQVFQFFVFARLGKYL
jgi:hypothetical protein